MHTRHKGQVIVSGCVPVPRQAKVLHYHVVNQAHAYVHVDALEFALVVLERTGRKLEHILLVQNKRAPCVFVLSGSHRTAVHPSGAGSVLQVRSEQLGPELMFSNRARVHFALEQEQFERPVTQTRILHGLVPPYACVLWFFELELVNVICRIVGLRQRCACLHVLPELASSCSNIGTPHSLRDRCALGFCSLASMVASAGVWCANVRTRRRVYHSTQAYGGTRP